MNPVDPKIEIYEKHSAPDLLVTWSSSLGVVGVVITAFLVARAYRRAKPGWLYVCVVAWATLPPAWFSIEYFFIYRSFGNPGTFDLFKHGQYVAAANWAGVLAALLALTSSPRFKERSDDGA